LIDVRMLFPIDLDADEVTIEVLGDVLVLERILLHDVAPVARRVSNREEYRLVFPPSLFECSVSPRLPPHRVVPVLK
jgi:hypothetical protein